MIGGILLEVQIKMNWKIQNSETFLLSNMSPQTPSFNRGIWRELEIAVRKLNDKKNILETYVLTAPVFYFDQKVETIGDDTEKYGIDVPIPHAFVKSVLAEDRQGRLSLWTFEMENKQLSGKLEDYLVVTYDVEQKVGRRLLGSLSLVVIFIRRKVSLGKCGRWMIENTG